RRHNNFAEAGRLFSLAGKSYDAASYATFMNPFDTRSSLCQAWSAICEFNASEKEISLREGQRLVRFADSCTTDAAQAMDVWGTSSQLAGARASLRDEILVAGEEIARLDKTTRRRIRKLRVAQVVSASGVVLAIVLVLTGASVLLDPVLDALSKLALLIGGGAGFYFALTKY